MKKSNDLCHLPDGFDRRSVVLEKEINLCKLQIYNLIWTRIDARGMVIIDNYRTCAWWTV